MTNVFERCLRQCIREMSYEQRYKEKWQETIYLRDLLRTEVQRKEVGDNTGRLRVGTGILKNIAGTAYREYSGGSDKLIRFLTRK